MERTKMEQELLAALKALVENPRPAMGSVDSDSIWSERYRRYEEAFDNAAALVAAFAQSASDEPTPRRYYIRRGYDAIGWERTEQTFDLAQAVAIAESDDSITNNWTVPEYESFAAHEFSEIVDAETGKVVACWDDGTWREPKGGRIDGDTETWIRGHG